MIVPLLLAIASLIAAYLVYLTICLSTREDAFSLRSKKDVASVVSAKPENVANVVSAKPEKGSLRRRVKSKEKVTAEDENANVISDLYSKAMQFMHTGKVHEAISTFSQILRLDENHCDARFYRAACYYHCKQVDETIADYRTLVEIEPSKSQYWCCLGDAILRMKDSLPEALECYDNCVKNDNNNHAGFFNRGSVYFRLGNYNRALSDYETARTLQPSDMNYSQAVLELKAKMAAEGGVSRGEVEVEPLDEVELSFSEAAEKVASEGANLDDNDKLKLYALYKQATVGPCNTAKPAFYEFTARAKWTAWHDLGHLSQPAAEKQYVLLVHRLLRNVAAEQSYTKKKSGSNFGPVFSQPTQSSESAVARDVDPLFKCASDGDINGLRNILQQDRSAISRLDDNGQGVFHWACDGEHFEMLEMLIKDFNADVNQRDEDGLTPLHYAALCDKIQLAKFLLQKGADKLAKDDDGLTAAENVDHNAELKELLS